MDYYSGGLVLPKIYRTNLFDLAICGIADYYVYLLQYFVVILTQNRILITWYKLQEKISTRQKVGSQ